jgi:DNA-binding response OmpR family regulator
MPRILIVDDSSDLLNILHWSLQRKGYSCSTAYYKAGIFNSLSKPKLVPALIIMDIDLNGDDGRNICMEIKENPTTKNIPIILCSGNHDLLQTFRDYQADDFIKKPFEINNIVEKIENLISKKAALLA